MTWSYFRDTALAIATSILGNLCGFLANCNERFKTLILILSLALNWQKISTNNLAIYTFDWSINSNSSYLNEILCIINLVYKFDHSHELDCVDLIFL